MAQIIVTNSGGGNGGGGGGGDGDMKKSVYDPTNVNGDAFDYNNFHDTPDLSGYQTTSNLVTNLTSPDDTHYPSAKAVADAITSAGGGDMLKSVYDPNNIEADAFDYTNFINTPTIPTNSDYVDLSTNQTVGGTKTFTTSPVVPSKSTDAANSATAIATEAQVYKKQDKLTTQTAYTSKGTASKVPQITTNTLGQVTGITEVNISYPSQVDNTAYAASWDGVTTTAPSKNAVYDKISAMDTTISSKAADSDVVKLTGNQTIAGTKTFSTSPVVPSKTTTATNTGTAIATEAQVYSVKSAVDLLSGLGKFLSLRDSSTGQPISFPLSTPYAYTTGDWFMVETVSTATPPVNYMPNGSSYTGAASTTQDTTNNVEQRDVYIYDGTNWLFQKNNEVQVSFSDIAGNATDNASLSSALNAKQNTLSTQTAYTSKGTSTKVPTITTNTLGQVTAITETDIAFPVTSVNGQTGAVTVSEGNTKTFYASTSSQWNTTLGQQVYDWIKSGNYAILQYGIQNVVIFTPTNTTTGSIYSQGYYTVNGSGDELESVATLYGITVSSGTVTAVDTSPTISSVGKFFAPGGTATTGYVVTKTADGYEWAAPAGGVDISSQANNILTSGAKIWAGSQSDYENLGSYDNNTVYLTI